MAAVSATEKITNGRSASHPPPAKTKALLRGVSHTFGAVAAAAAGTLLTLDAPTSTARWGCFIYTLTLTAMFTISATYHRPTWSLHARSIMRKLDHAGIYCIIAGTYTPLCLLALDQETGRHLLLRVWAGALAGIVHSLISKGGTGSKVLSAALYVALGWIALPYSKQMKTSLTPLASWLVLSGGIIYSLGAVVYGAKWPDPVPHVFGYHEVFHALIIVASILHFGAVRDVVNGMKALTCAAAP